MERERCDICHGPEIYGELPQLMSSDYWRIELNPNQQHIGRVFVGLREHKSSIADLDDAELLDFRRIVHSVELGVTAAFGANLFNWMCLMNDAARDGKEPHVHWHGIPRYAKSVDFEGHIYTDGAWPRQYNTGTDLPYPPKGDKPLQTKVISGITDAIQRAMQTTSL